MVDVMELAGKVASLPPYALLALAVGVLVLVGVVAYLVFSGQIWFWVALGVVAFALYYAWASGALYAFLADVQSDPRKYVPLFAGLLVFGLAFPFIVSSVVYADLSVTLSYRVVPPKEGGLLGGLFGAAVDANSIDANVVVVDAYYGVPLLHQPSFDPELADRVGAGYYLVVEVPDLRSRYIFQLRNVGFVTRYFEGRTTERFFLYSIRLPDEPQFPIVVTVYANGVPIWSKQFVAHLR